MTLDPAFRGRELKPRRVPGLSPRRALHLALAVGFGVAAHFDPAVVGTAGLAVAVFGWLGQLDPDDR